MIIKKEKYGFIGAIITVIFMALFLVFPIQMIGLLIFAWVGAEDERWRLWGTLGTIARERTDPDR